MTAPLHRNSRRFDVLLCAWEQPGEWTASAYAEDVGISRTAATGAACALRQRGFLRHDREWRLTPEGLAALHATIIVPPGDPRSAAPSTSAGGPPSSSEGEDGGGPSPGVAP